MRCVLLLASTIFVRSPVPSAKHSFVPDLSVMVYLAPLSPSAKVHFQGHAPAVFPNFQKFTQCLLYSFILRYSFQESSPINGIYLFIFSVSVMLRLLYSSFLRMSIIFSSFFGSIILVFLDICTKKELQTASRCLKFLYKYTILFFTFLQFLRQIWKHADRPFQNALHIGNGDAVVSDRHLLINGTFHTIADLALIQHTAAAVNDQCIF